MRLFIIVLLSLLFAQCSYIENHYYDECEDLFNDCVGIADVEISFDGSVWLNSEQLSYPNNSVSPVSFSTNPLTQTIYINVSENRDDYILLNEPDRVWFDNCYSNEITFIYHSPKAGQIVLNENCWNVLTDLNMNFLIVLPFCDND